jgi:hypothetical protein
LVFHIPTMPRLLVHSFTISLSGYGPVEQHVDMAPWKHG